jgi:hypothetical protein
MVVEKYSQFGVYCDQPLINKNDKNKQVTIFNSIRLETKDVRAHARFQLSSEYIPFNPLKRTDEQRKPKMV